MLSECICVFMYIPGLTYNLWQFCIHYNLRLELNFSSFIEIYSVMKLQHDYKRVKDYYICVASVYLMVKKTKIKLDISEIHFQFTIGISFRSKGNQRR